MDTHNFGKFSTADVAAAFDAVSTGNTANTLELLQCAALYATVALRHEIEEDYCEVKE